MEVVKNKIMYQVATDRNYKVGDILTFGKELNAQAQRILEIEIKDPNTITEDNQLQK